MNRPAIPNLRDAADLYLAKAFYFLYYAALAALSSFLPLYYESLGLSGRQIGVLRGLMPLIMLFGAPLWGAVADATQRHKRLLLLAIGGTLLAALGMRFAMHFAGLIPTVAVFALFGAPITSLIDNTVLDMLGEARDKYGRQRLWGAVGWGMTAPLVGALSERAGQHWYFYGYLILMGGAWLVVHRLPVSHTHLRRDFWKDLGTLLSNRQWAIFLASVLVGSLHLSLSQGFLFLHLDRLGASRTLMGFSLTVATFSEVPIWFYSDAMLRRWGTRGMLILSLLACVIQAFGYAWIPTPALVLPFQLLHGLAFPAMWAAGVAYAAEIAPEGVRATAQGLFGALVMGLKSALGAFLGGVLYDEIGPVAMFRWGGVAALVGLGGFVLAARDTSR